MSSSKKTAKRGSYIKPNFYRKSFYDKFIRVPQKGLDECLGIADSNFE
jgi:hypothetical protein